MENSALYSSRKILVVDDDDSIRDLCALVLRTAGYAVETAVHGADGLEKIKGSSFDLVITDLNMPELGGLELYSAAIGEEHDGLRFLFMTGAASDEQVDYLASLDLKLLEKPFRISGLLEAVDSLMREPLKTALMGGEGGSRREGRMCYVDGCGLIMQAGALSGKTLDISPNGIRAAYAGEAIEAGTEVLVKVSMNGLSFERSGKAVWTEERGGQYISGIEFNRPMPVSTIVNIQANEP